MEASKKASGTRADIPETRSMYEMDASSSPDASDLESNTERDSLLSADDRDDGDAPVNDSVDTSKEATHRRIRIKIYIATLVANAAFIILVPAQTKIFEQSICLRWYDANRPDQVPDSRLIPEGQCKLPPIQRELASLRGLYDMFDAAPALLMSIPMGILMDMVGRRPLLLINLCTITAQQFWIALVALGADHVPVQLIWFGPLLNFISGGMMVLQMAFMCLITDITPRETLATALFRLASVSQFCRVIGPVIAGGLMQISAWWAIIVGLLGLFAMIGIAWTIPETMEFTASGPDSDMGSPPQSRLQRAWPRIKTGFVELKIVWSDWRLIVLVCLYPFLTIGGALADVLQQYISNRYNWTLADATFIFSLQGVAATAALFVLLPFLSDFIERRFGLSAISLNVTMARISCSILALSYAIEGVAPNIGILIVGLLVETLGLGGGSALKALAASLVEHKDNGRVFSVVTIFEVLSSLMAYPSTAALLNLGFDKGGGIWLGLPFFLAAVAAGVACVILVLARFERGPRL